MPPRTTRMHTDAPEPRLTPLTDDLRALVARVGNRPATVRELLQALEERGTAVLIVLLAAPFVLPIPLPGLSIPFGIALAILGVRLGLARPPWLPGFLGRRQIRPSTLAAIVRAAERVVAPIERLLCARLVFLFGPSFQGAVGLGIVLGALLLIPSIPLPGINALPSLAIVLLALGLIERDGVATLLGGVVLVLAGAYLYLWWDVAVTAARRIMEG